jgi:hypothetical protein
VGYRPIVRLSSCNFLCPLGRNINLTLNGMPFIRSVIFCETSLQVLHSTTNEALKIELLRCNNILRCVGSATVGIHVKMAKTFDLFNQFNEEFY